MIKFLLNQEVREEAQLSPNMTVLNYLRTKAKKTGTKEGCGSGDCGTCTVILGELNNGQLQYRSVNACLTFVSALHGKQLITVEDLQSKDGSLHPVQQALVDFHGSQCGYCTPGIIMSMFALSKNRPQADKQDVLEFLSGNLCRCTGYRPIIDAALSLCKKAPYQDQFAEQVQSTIDKLNSISNEPATLQFNNLSSFSPATINELAELLQAYPHAHIVAGGTDLAVDVTQRHREIESLIDVSRVMDMKVVNETNHHLVIGANVSLSDCFGVLNKHYPDFGEILRRFGSKQVRNQATLGGNIGNASPIGDTPPLLIALDAGITLSRSGESRTIPVEDYYLGYKETALRPSEFIKKIIIPKPEASKMFRAYKVSKRLGDDISAVCGGFNIELEDDTVTFARIAFGGMAEIPKRAVHCEQELIGKKWNIATINTAMAALASDFEPLSDFRASKAYRNQTVANMLYRFFIEQQNSQIETRVTSYV
ncbi:xanthine dehydrogenase small subunit [Photobacterium lipolyticum]|uniref:Xanthine dehydrogenase small subunit n=1 Tax=Photobacterium lipolyticum TaxID=266810 RepID=A0A2T3N3W4_9GAMM|nr:xanthine dehydrogenase small subunit [Photobacterium lipolyticum]PSW06955.1 xanthine dehydrogenase small subunit [Photobacterium lipolyticum]